MSTLLKELKNNNASIPEKVKLYNDCNRKVAILCNHKRTVGASHEAQMEKMTDRVGNLQLHKWTMLTESSRSKASDTKSGVRSR